MKGTVTMNFTDAVKTCLSKYVDMSGRAQRSEYWWFALFGMIISYAPILLAGLTGIAAISFIGTIASLAVLVPSICAGVRRLHDIGKPGGWIFIVLVPVVGGLLLLYWFISRGTEGANEYGEDPLA